MSSVDVWKECPVKIRKGIGRVAVSISRNLPFESLNTKKATRTHNRLKKLPTCRV